MYYTSLYTLLSFMWIEVILNIKTMRFLISKSNNPECMDFLLLTRSQACVACVACEALTFCFSFCIFCFVLFCFHFIIMFAYKGLPYQLI